MNMCLVKDSYRCSCSWFSVTGSFVTKTRAKLGDDSVESLVFLKKDYDGNMAEK